MLNAAQTLILELYPSNPLPVWPQEKAPHAYRDQPARRHISRRKRFAIAYDDEGRVTRVRLPRLFKGHRP